MIETTNERAQLAEDIRSAIAYQEHCAANAMHAQIRHMHEASAKAMRLGLCVVESGVALGMSPTEYTPTTDFISAVHGLRSNIAAHEKTIAEMAQALRQVTQDASYHLMWAVDGTGCPATAVRAVKALRDAYASADDTAKKTTADLRAALKTERAKVAERDAAAIRLQSIQACAWGRVLSACHISIIKNESPMDDSRDVAAVVDGLHAKIEDLESCSTLRAALGAMMHESVVQAAERVADLVRLARLGLRVMESGIGKDDCENVANAYLSGTTDSRARRVVVLLEALDEELNREEGKP